MSKSKEEIEWMFVKYGNKTKPWTYVLNLPNVDGTNHGGFSENAQNSTFEYTYGKKNCDTGKIVWENEPKRTLNIQNPSLYKGRDPYHAGNYWHNTDRVFIVNGQCNKADANFLGQFKFKEIGDYGIVLGSYPSCERDVQKIKKAKCTAVMDIQTSNDHLQRGIKTHQINEWHRNIAKINKIINF